MTALEKVMKARFKNSPASWGHDEYGGQKFGPERQTSGFVDSNSVQIVCGDGLRTKTRRMLNVNGRLGFWFAMSHFKLHEAYMQGPHPRL